MKKIIKSDSFLKEKIIKELSEIGIISKSIIKQYFDNNNYKTNSKLIYKLLEELVDEKRICQLKIKGNKKWRLY